MPAKTVILIAAPARRDTIKQLLLADRQLDVVGELSSAASLHLVAQLAPDIIILDCAAPQVNPLVVLPQLRAHTYAPQIIALSATNAADEGTLLRALGATACAILDQPGALTEALAAARTDKGFPLPASPAARLGTRSPSDRTQRHSRYAQ
jgi:DNA-binding NarL/FixJ family response regulator